MLVRVLPGRLQVVLAEQQRAVQPQPAALPRQVAYPWSPMQRLPEGAVHAPVWLRVLERGWLLNEVWGFDFPTTANSLEVYIGYLRRKTEGDGESRLIHTVRGIGYVLRETPP